MQKSDLSRFKFSEIQNRELTGKLAPSAKWALIPLEEDHKPLDGVNIKPALTDIDKNRNWAIFAAEEKVKASPQAQGKHVSVKKTGKGRGVYVNEVAVFTQVERHARGGVFLGEYSHLSLS